jgi:hypothetical protein
MRDITGKVVYYLFDDFEGDPCLSQVKLTRRKNKNERDDEEEDEYEGVVVRHIFGESKLVPNVLYVSDMIFSNRKLVIKIWEMLNY